MIRRLFAPVPAALRGAALALCLLPGAALAECHGMNILDTMPAEERDALKAAAAAVPYPEGNFWTATKDGRTITLVGTYHLDDPRHQATLDLLAPRVTAAPVLLVEAGPEEEKLLMAHMARDPSVMMITSGPTLLELLPPDTWERLKVALDQRGIPGFMAAKFQPWYVTILLALPPCAMETMVEPKGLDGMLIDTATAAGVPVRALEPYDTVFTLFEAMEGQDKVALVDQSLALEDVIVDFSITLADAYFDGQNWLMWELMRQQSLASGAYTAEEVDRDMAIMEDVLLTRRNTAWIPVIEAAAEEGPAVVAFGALHLPGTTGVLQLLAERGWTIAPAVLP